MEKSKNSFLFTLENFPNEIISEILSNLEIVAFIRCSQVSKRIRTICLDKLTRNKIIEKVNLCYKVVPTSFIQGMVYVLGQ